MLPVVSHSDGWSAAGPASSMSLVGSALAPATELELTYSDDLSWLHANHYFDVGINVLRGGKSQKIFVDTNGTWDFGGAFSNNPIADFLTGYAGSLNESEVRYGRAYGHYTRISPYFQDQWKVPNPHVRTAAAALARFSARHFAGALLSVSIMGAAERFPTLNADLFGNEEARGMPLEPRRKRIEKSFGRTFGG